MQVVKFIPLAANTNRSLTLLYILMLMACWYRHKGTCAQNCMILRMYWLSDPRLASLQGSPWGPEWPSLYQNFLYSVTWKEWRRSFEYTPLALLLFGKQYVLAFLYALFRLKSVFLYVEKKIYTDTWVHCTVYPKQVWRKRATCMSSGGVVKVSAGEVGWSGSG